MKQESNILIVDDHFLGREVLGELLGNEGYTLEFASDGMEALEKAKAFQPDLILLDVMMPGMDGFEVCHQVRSNPLLADVPIILVTALDDRQSRLKGIESGADDFVSKPFDRLELKARVRTITRLNRSQKLRQEHALLERAHAELLETHEATLRGWVKALDIRDKETEGHTQRVVDMTITLAQQAGIDGDALVDIRRGALLHDIGKLGIPDNILLKEGPLSDEEWEIMRLHPILAQEWLSPIPYLRSALEIPYCHHEKWDGSGYPQGLSGEDIPFSARLFALVDVWDALRSNRPYRKAWSIEKTSAYIRDHSGSHFDPSLINFFIQYTSSLGDKQ